MKKCSECKAMCEPAVVRETIIGEHVQCEACASLPSPARNCGTCRACCTILAIEEFSKPANEACQHLCAGGCGVYETRPGTCYSFECMWLHGERMEIFKADALRPDRCGVVFYPEPYNGQTIMIAQLNRPRDINRATVKKAVNSLTARGMKVAVVTKDGTILIDRRKKS